MWSPALNLSSQAVTAAVASSAGPAWAGAANAIQAAAAKKIVLVMMRPRVRPFATRTRWALAGRKPAVSAPVENERQPRASVSRACRARASFSRSAPHHISLPPSESVSRPRRAPRPKRLRPGRTGRRHCGHGWRC